MILINLFHFEVPQFNIEKQLLFKLYFKIVYS